MNSTALALFAKRRTQYALGKTLPISEAQVETLVHQAMRLAPSSFNSQSSRAIILFGAATDAKMDSFAAGAGTVLFFEDQDTVKSMQEQYPLYADYFPIFSEHSAGMAQFAVWTALAEAGVGASLQHYMPLIDEAVAQEWHVPTAWKLRAQMPFGANAQPIGEKTFIDDAVRFRTVR